MTHDDGEESHVAPSGTTENTLSKSCNGDAQTPLGNGWGHHVHVPMARSFLICYNCNCWYGCGCTKLAMMLTNDAPSLIGDGGDGGCGSCLCYYLCQQRW